MGCHVYNLITQNGMKTRNEWNGNENHIIILLSIYNYMRDTKARTLHNPLKMKGFWIHIGKCPLYIVCSYGMAKLP